MTDAASNRGVHRLALVASAVAGRRLEVVLVDVQTHTDGTTIYIDSGTDPADIRDAVVAQAALLAVGSLRKDMVARLSRRRGKVVSRYVGLELRRAAVQLASILPPSAVGRLTPAPDELVSADSDDSLRRALGAEILPEPPAWAGGLAWSALRRAGESDLRSRPVTADVPVRTGSDEDDSMPQPAPTESKEPEIPAMPFPALSRWLRESLRKLLGADGTEIDGNQGVEEVAVLRHGRRARGEDGNRIAIDLSEAFDTPHRVGTRYPEWDCHSGAYRRNWCTVVECDPFHPDADSGTTTFAPTPLRTLARVGLELERHRRQAEGNSLDLSALVDFEVDRRRGGNPDPAIYEHTLFTRRDLSVLVLLDCSGSTAEDSCGHTVFDEERRLAGDLTGALERLGDQVATYGFYSRGRGAVTLLRVKEFSKRFDSAARRRLAALHPSGFTRMGAAIRHATLVLVSQALSENMVLLVIGDGLPYDDGYENRYARADVRQAIEEAMKRGIGVAGLGIRSSTSPETLEEIWSQAPFRVIGRSGDADRQLRRLLLDAIRLTRGNGRRREMSTGASHHHFRHFREAQRRSLNTYA